VVHRVNRSCQLSVEPLSRSCHLDSLYQAPPVFTQPELTVAISVFACVDPNILLS